jgi:ABC-type transport system substrate-binding protein
MIVAVTGISDCARRQLLRSATTSTYPDAMRRRTMIAASAATGLLARPSVVVAATSRVLKFVPQANLSILDPVWTGVNVTRNHGYMVYDTLYGRDADFRPQRQMAAGELVEDDGKRITITLRDGLSFHDGAPVLARDAVASIRRWMKRNPYGQKLESVTDGVEAADDRRIVFRLSRPFPQLLGALSVIASSCFIMPQRLALTDPFKQVTDPTGSGPFRFKADEYDSGSRVVYERNAAYVPRPDGAVSFTAGPKRVFFDRVEWRVITDSATAAAALLQGEIDWFEIPTPDQQQLLKRDENISVSRLDDKPLSAVMRLNFLHPPFNDVRIRRALIPAVAQIDFMNAVAGTDAANYRADAGVFTPGTAMASDAGMDVLTGPRDVAMSKRMLQDTGWRSQRMRLIGPGDFPAIEVKTEVAADLFGRLDFDMDYAVSDWGTVIQRRNSRAPVEQGGWSALVTTLASADASDPAAHPLVRGNGLAGTWGWPTIPRLEQLRDAWFDSPTLAAQQAISADIQRTVLDEVAYIPLGAYYTRTATRRDLTGRVPGFAIFWNIRRGDGSP